MGPELVSELAASQVAGGSVAQPTTAISASYNLSLADVARFEAAYFGGSGGGGGGAAATMQTQSASAIQPTSILDSPAMRAVFGPLERINNDASRLAADTQAMAGKGDLTPGEMIQLTMRCHEFLFHCEMTSNVANRSGDGVQQLFRQQS
jgi:hypothetical protein